MHTRSFPSYSLEPASFLQSVKHGDRNWAGRRGQPPAAAHKPQRKVEEAEEGFKKKKKKKPSVWDSSQVWKGKCGIKTG